MPSRRTATKADDDFLALLSPNAPAMKKGNSSLLGGLQKMIGSVQPNPDGDGTDESSDEEQAPLAITVVPSPTRSTKAKKVGYHIYVSELDFWCFRWNANLQRKGRDG